MEFSWFYRFSESVAVENNRLKTDMADLKQQNQKRGNKLDKQVELGKAQHNGASQHGVLLTVAIPDEDNLHTINCRQTLKFWY